MFTEAHLSHRAIDTRIYVYTYITYIRTRMYEEIGCRRTQVEPPMRVCAHLGILTGVDANTVYTWVHHTRARAHMHTQMRRCARSDRVYAHTHTHTCTHTYIRSQMCARSDTRLIGRARVPLLTRARTHVRTRTRTCTESTRTHTCTHMHSQIYRPTWWITSSGRAVVLRRRSRRSRAHARAPMHKRARTRTLQCTLRAHSDLRTYALTYMDNIYKSISIYRYRYSYS